MEAILEEARRAVAAVPKDASSGADSTATYQVCQDLMEIVHITAYKTFPTSVNRPYLAE